MRGKGTHKGKSRKYTAPDEIDRQMGRTQEKPGDSESEDELDQDTTKSTKPLPKLKSKTKPQQSDDDSESAKESVEFELANTNAPIIDTCNPNHAHGTSIERPNRKEAAAAARAIMDPLKLKSEAELASDLARLQLVRKEREQAALKREQERQAQEARRIAAAKRAEAKLMELRQKSKPGAKKRTKDTSSRATSNSTKPDPSGATKEVEPVATASATADE